MVDKKMRLHIWLGIYLFIAVSGFIQTCKRDILKFDSSEDGQNIVLITEGSGDAILDWVKTPKVLYFLPAQDALVDSEVPPRKLSGPFSPHLASIFSTALTQRPNSRTLSSEISRFSFANVHPHKEFSLDRAENWHEPSADVAE